MTESDLEFDLFLEAFEAYWQAKRAVGMIDDARNDLRAAFSRLVAGAVRKELAGKPDSP